jgi:hypothetical protein
MSLASFASIQLARFDSLTRNEGLAEGLPLPALFCGVAADTRAAATEPASQQAFVFLILGLHADAESAHSLLERRAQIVPWMDGAREIYGAVLEPFRHKGEANFLNRESPGTIFGNLAEPAAVNAPMVVITSVGWQVNENLNMKRVEKFGAGVAGVRIGMTAVDGLHSQQTFSFPGRLTVDPVTVSFWRDDAAVRTFSYGPGGHRRQMDILRAEDLADRTSFTRFRVLESVGSWYGSDPQLW